jgi:hypothetical protein
MGRLRMNIRKGVIMLNFVAILLLCQGSTYHRPRRAGIDESVSRFAFLDAHKICPSKLQEQVLAREARTTR